MRSFPWLAFVRRREPDYTSYDAPVHRETGAVVYDELDGITDPVRYSDFDGSGEHPRARRFTSYAPFEGFGHGISLAAFGGKLSSPEPLAWTPTGALSVEAQREVVLRPPARGM